MIIFHITSRYQWERSKESGVYEAPSIHFEGFIHCSRAGQLQRTANEFFKGQNDLVLLCIDTEKVHWEIRWENLEGGSDLFPHIYGPVDADAVVKVLKFDHDSEGLFHLPPGLTVWAEGAPGAAEPRKTGPRPQPAPEAPDSADSSPFTVPIRDTSVYEPEFVAALPHDKPSVPEIEDLDQIRKPSAARKTPTVPPVRAATGPLPPLSIRPAAWGVLALAVASGVAIAFQPGTLGQAALAAGLDRGSHGVVAALGLLVMAASLGFSGWLGGRLGLRLVAAGGTLLIAVGSAMLAAGSLPLLYLGQVVFMIGAGAAAASLLVLLVGVAPRRRAFLFTGLGLGGLVFAGGLAGLISLPPWLLFAWTLLLAVGAAVLAILGRGRDLPSAPVMMVSRSGKFLAGLLAGTGFMLGAVSGAYSVLPSFPASQTAGLSLLGASAIGSLLAWLGAGGGGALADWLGGQFRRWGRSDMAGAVVAFAGCVLIPVGVSVMALGANAFNTALGYWLAFLGAGAAAVGITGLALSLIPGWPRTLIFGGLAGAALLGGWLALAVGGLSSFSQAAAWLNLAMICALVTLAGSVVALIHLALRSPSEQA